MVGRHLQGGGNTGGVFNPRNLSLYALSWNNPIVLRDPDGREPIVFYLPGNGKADTGAFKATAARLVSQIRALGIKVGDAIPYSSVAARASSIWKAGGKVSAVVAIGHGSGGEVASGAVRTEHGNVVADTPLATVADQAKVASKGVVCSVACDGASDYGEATNYLSAKGIAVAGFSDFLWFENADEIGKFSGLVAASEKGARQEPGDLVPPVSTPPAIKGRTILGLIRDAEALVNKPRKTP